MGKFPELFCDHDRPNPGFSETNHESSEERKIHPMTGFYYFKIRKITKLIHTEKKSLTLTLLLCGDCRGDSHLEPYLDNQFKRKR